MEEDSSLYPSSDLQQALEFLIKDRELRWPSKADSIDIELLLGTQFLELVAYPFDSEYETDDLD